MNICEHLTTSARLFPDKVAIVFEGERITFSQLDQMSCCAAETLIEAGVIQGDRVALMLPNVPAFAVWYFAALRVGAIAVSVSTRLSSGEVSFLVADSGSKVFVADEQAAGSTESLPKCVVRSFVASDLGDQCNGESILRNDLVESTWMDREPNDPALILYTSGTTGVAKGATLSNLNVRSNVCAFNHLCEMRSNDRILLTVPLFHCFGQNALLNSAFNAAATIVLQRKFDPAESRKLIRNEKVTQLYGVPTMFQLFHDCCDTDDLSSVRYCFSAAAPLPIQISRRWREKFGQPIYEGYGLTETSPFASYNHRSRYLMGSIGTPIDCVEMKIVNTQTGRTCPPGELGEIAIRGPNVMIGYWNRPDDTAAAIRDGWFHSGDIGRRDENGFYYIVDRVKDMISVGGLKVYPAEVERILLDHPQVTQAAVVGFPDEVFGEKVVAFVTTTDASPAKQPLVPNINEYCRSRLADYKRPKLVLTIEELPRNPSGKVLKTVLREHDLPRSPSENQSLVEGTPTNDESDASPMLRDVLENTHVANRRSAAMEYVQDVVCELIGGDERPDPDSRFLDAGLDSLMIVDFSVRLQAEIGPEVAIPATLVFDYPRIRDLAEFLVESIAPDKSGGAAFVDHTMRQSSTLIGPHRTATRISNDIESMSEEEALEQLMRKVDSN